MVPPTQPDALEHEGLWSERTSSTGCEVMRSSGLHGKDGLTLRIQTQKEMRKGKMNERGKDRKDRRGSQERAGARSLVTVYPAAGASRSLRSDRKQQRRGARQECLLLPVANFANVFDARLMQQWSD